jgi:hypothetical protein
MIFNGFRKSRYGTLTRKSSLKNVRQIIVFLLFIVKGSLLGFVSGVGIERKTIVLGITLFVDVE